MLSSVIIMKLRFKQLLVLAGLRVLQLLRTGLPAVLRFLLTIIVKPVAYVWFLFLRPVVMGIYKLFVLFRERARTFFHAQHKLLAIVTHRVSLHIVMVVMTASIVTANVFQAQEVRAEEFGQDTLLSQVFHPDEEFVITAETIASGSSRYIESSTSVRLQPQLGDVVQPTVGNELAVTESGALVKSNVLGSNTQQNTSIQRYVVQPGDTASTIAAEFGVSTQTILSSNNLSSASLIKPGQELYILPTSGVAHTVKSGETVAEIAKKYGAKEEDIIEYNDLLSAENLIAGVEVIIPGGKQPEPVVVPSATTTTTATGSGSSFTRVLTGGNAAPSSSAPAVSGGKWQWPTTCSRISQYYGYRHTGIDVDCNFGDAILAAEGGTVTTVAHFGGYGLHVEITHSNGIVTRYAHLQKVYVSPGQVVGRGQSLGEMGSTGRSSGSHLHFEIIVNGGFINPYSYL